MQSRDILRSTPIASTFRSQQVIGMFDLEPSGSSEHRWRVEMPVDEQEWKIGLIMGPSGSGKTTIAKEMFPDAYFHKSFEWPPDKCVIDGFPDSLDGKEIFETINAVGFSSPPSWLKPFRVLSNGQQFRCELARCILLDHDTVVFDEFTSVVDRDVAKICSSAVAKTIRRRPRPRLVAVSCHYDILEWLAPDWVYDVATSGFQWRQLRRRPPIKLDIVETDRSAWRIFEEHHYLTRDLSRGARCFLALWGGRPVAFSSYIHFPHPSNPRWKRIHRTVVLPDFQGVGIGNALESEVADMAANLGNEVTTTLSHPALIKSKARDPRWKMIRRPSRATKPSTTSTERHLGKKSSTGRLTVSFRYCGAQP